MNKKNKKKIKVKYIQSELSKENDLKLNRAFEILFEEVLKKRQN